MKEKKLSSKLQYECSFMKLFEDDVELPNGNHSKRVWVDHPGAAAILPITKEGKIILVKQYRYPTQSIMLEIPAGKKDSVSETGAECIVRELEEETGYRSDDIQKVMDIHNCVGYSNELIELFVAYDCYPVLNPISGDDDECIELHYYTKEEVSELLQLGMITDVKTVLMLKLFVHGEYEKKNT